jgi:hypothetical protein
MQFSCVCQWGWSSVPFCARNKMVFFLRYASTSKDCNLLFPRNEDTFFFLQEKRFCLVFNSLTQSRKVCLCHLCGFRLESILNLTFGVLCDLRRTFW